MVLSTNSISKFAKVQYTPDSGMLGVAIFLPADTIVSFVDAGADSIEYTLKAVPEGILIGIDGDQA